MVPSLRTFHQNLLSLLLHYIHIYIHLFIYYIKMHKIPAAKSPGWFTFYPGTKYFLGHACDFCFLSPFWRLELWGGSYIFGKLCTSEIHTNTHTHTHTYIYIYIYIYVCVCVCVCACVCVCNLDFGKLTWEWLNIGKGRQRHKARHGITWRKYVNKIQT